MNKPKKENAFIRKRLEKKQVLLIEYESLVKEKEDLIVREAESNELIKAKLKSMKEEISYGR